MNQKPPSKPFVIDQSHLRRARNLARQSGRPVIVELEHLNHGASEELVRQLAHMFGMNPTTLADFDALTPAFDLLPLALARRWRCMLLREADGSLVGVLADPFDPDLQLWLNGQARGAVLMRLASTADLQAYTLAQVQNARLYDAQADDGVDAADEQVHEHAVQAMHLAADLLRRAMRR